MDEVVFRDRTDAGRRLAGLLRPLVGDDRSGAGRLVVLGMARGGVPVAAAIADALDAPLDVIVVRKLGHPLQPELGLGAIGEGGVRVVNDALVQRLGVAPSTLESVAVEQDVVLEQRVRRYRAGRPAVSLQGSLAVVVDDGLATGFTAHAALLVARQRGAGQVVLAVPVGPPGAVEALRAVADEVVCLVVSDAFMGISQWYADFHQVSDAQVTRLLAHAAKRHGTVAGPDGAPG